MLYEFVLIMDDLIVCGTQVDQCIFSWQQELPESQVTTYSLEWLNSHNYLTSRMVGLERVGESSLTIEPIERRSASPHY